MRGIVTLKRLAYFFENYRTNSPQTNIRNTVRQAPSAPLPSSGQAIAQPKPRCSPRSRQKLHWPEQGQSKLAKGVFLSSAASQSTLRIAVEKDACCLVVNLYVPIIASCHKHPFPIDLSFTKLTVGKSRVGVAFVLHPGLMQQKLGGKVLTRLEWSETCLPPGYDLEEVSHRMKRVICFRRVILQGIEINNE